MRLTKSLRNARHSLPHFWLLQFGHGKWQPLHALLRQSQASNPLLLIRPRPSYNVFDAVRFDWLGLKPSLNFMSMSKLFSKFSGFLFILMIEWGVVEIECVHELLLKRNRIFHCVWTNYTKCLIVRTWV